MVTSVSSCCVWLTALGVKIPQFTQRHVILLPLHRASANDDVVEHFDPKQLSRSNEITRDFDVGLGRRRVAAGMIVDEHDGRGIRGDGPLEDLARMDQERVEGALGDGLQPDQPAPDQGLPPDQPPPDRCGTCTRCIDACPTAAIVPTQRAEGPEYAIDSRLCIAYFTIELRGPIPEKARAGMGNHVFGCDICQDVCPWNSRAPVTTEPGLLPQNFAPPLEKLAALSEAEFRERFGNTPVSRARYSGFLRNVTVAMGNLGLQKFRAPLQTLAQSPDPMVAEHARWALEQLE